MEVFGGDLRRQQGTAVCASLVDERNDEREGCPVVGHVARD
jgi:hypothetical protein